MSAVPNPTPILRFIHVNNLSVCLRRGGLHAPNYTPDDGLVYRTIHSIDIQRKRRVRTIPRGPGGAIHDYVAFYFGYLSPMLFQLKTGRVEGYDEGQRPLIYLVSEVQNVDESSTDFVFSDGHGIAAYTDWYDDIDELAAVDWSVVNLKYWADDTDDMDRQRRKQAEFLVHRFCDWSLIHEIAVIDKTMKRDVETILGKFPDMHAPPVSVRRNWYY